MHSTLRFDVVVVGAGFAGLMCADRLSRLGYRVAIVEKAEATLAGTSSRNEGWLHAGTYHALSIPQRREAMAVAKRCRLGWEEIQRRFPECVEVEKGKAVAIVPESSLAESLSRWEEAQVGHTPLTPTQYEQLDGYVSIGRDEAAFSVDDTGINTRMLAASLLSELRTRGVRVFLGAEILGRADGLLRLHAHGETHALEHRFVVCAAGYSTERACAQLGLPPTPVRLWRSHLVTLPRVAPLSVFGVAAQQAAMINHGAWSIIGFNEDATVVDAPTFEVDPAVADRLEEAVRRRFPAADMKATRRTACVKVDYAPDANSARSLNVRMLPVTGDAVVVLPGKMTEAPFSANVVASHVFDMLGQGSVTGRPMDSYELVGQAAVR
ncbi:FAD-dependent oxidoreductase [Streptomyces sp. NPDC090445]|uniref:FAD-dependent oxidoreductase n=1 Tax=Streptomyces sp. NPDC090445 TaxID=3365963 RepID=UPI003806BC2B